jgi:hypothetical protein
VTDGSVEELPKTLHGLRWGMSYEEAREALGVTASGPESRVLDLRFTEERFDCVLFVSVRGLARITCESRTRTAWGAKSIVRKLKAKVEAEGPETAFDPYVSRGRGDFDFFYTWYARVTLTPLHPQSLPMRPFAESAWFESHWPEGWTLAAGRADDIRKEASIFGPGGETPEISVVFTSKNNRWPYERAKHEMKSDYAKVGHPPFTISGYPMVKAGPKASVLTNSGMFVLTLVQDPRLTGTSREFEQFAASFRSKIPGDQTPSISFEKEIIRWHDPSAAPTFMRGLRLEQDPADSRVFYLGGRCELKGVLRFVFKSEQLKAAGKPWQFLLEDTQVCNEGYPTTGPGRRISFPAEMGASDDWSALFYLKGWPETDTWGPFSVR